MKTIVLLFAIIPNVMHGMNQPADIFEAKNKLRDNIKSWVMGASDYEKVEESAKEFHKYYPTNPMYRSYFGVVDILEEEIKVSFFEMTFLWEEREQKGKLFNQVAAIFSSWIGAGIFAYEGYVLNNNSLRNICTKGFMYLFGIGLTFQGILWCRNCKQIRSDLQKASNNVARFKECQKEKLNSLFDKLTKQPSK